MKYLKSYKIFESSSEDDLLGTINDILLPISDSGIEYEIKNFEKIGLIHIKIWEQNEEVNDCIKHLENYLKELGNLYFVGRPPGLDTTHISIENNFNEEIEKDFLKIIDGIREVKHKDFPDSRLWVSTDLSGIRFEHYVLFNQDEESGFLYYDYTKIFVTFASKGLSTVETNALVRYLVGKHLKLEALKPFANSFGILKR